MPPRRRASWVMLSATKSSAVALAAAAFVFSAATAAQASPGSSRSRCAPSSRPRTRSSPARTVPCTPRTRASAACSGSTRTAACASSTSAAAPPASPPRTARSGSPTAITSSIVKLGLDGSQTSYPVTPGAFPSDIVLGSDGALWFAESRGNAIGRAQRRRPGDRVPAADPGRLRGRHHRRARTARCGSPSPTATRSAGSRPPGRSPSSRSRPPDSAPRPDRRRGRRRALVR